MAGTTMQASSEELLRQEIMADAQRQAARALRNAEREAAALERSAAEEADEFAARTLEAAREEASRRERLQQAKIPIAKRRLHARHIEDELEVLKAAALELLAPEHRPVTREALLELIAGPLRRMRGDQFVMQLSPADNALLGSDYLPRLRELSGKAGLTLEAGEPLAAADVGPLLRDQTGGQMWDNRLAARLRRLWPSLRREIAKELLGEAPDWQ